MMHRRHFLKLAGAAPLVMLAPSSALGAPGGNKVLVLVELKGGNDGLNTVVPFADPTYYKLRPQIAISKDKVLGLNDKIGLHPALENLREVFDSKQMALVQGVGYDSPNRSHFRSIEIWETASRSDEFLSDGWLSRAMEDHGDSSLVIDGVTVGESDAGPMRGGSRSLMVQNPEQLLRATRKLIRPTGASSKNSALDHVLTTQRELLRATEGLEKHLKRGKDPGVAFPKTRFGRQLEVAARLLVNDVPLMVVRVTLGSFDTHANQQNAHQRLLTELDTGLAALRQALVKHGRWSDTLIMTYSEFGRRAAQNGSRGTDHGTAAPHFMLGGGVKGGIYGAQPSLTDLAGGDLVYNVDFRELYREAAVNWLGLKVDELSGHRGLGII